MSDKDRLRKVERLVAEALGLIDQDAISTGARNDATAKLLVALNELGDEIRPRPPFSPATWKRIDKAARMSVDGCSWKEVGDVVGHDFCADLRKRSRYLRWFCYSLGDWRLRKLLRVSQAPKRRPEE